MLVAGALLFGAVARFGAVALFGALGLGCGPAVAPVRAYPGALRAPSTVGGDFSIDQSVTAIHAQGQESFRAVIEKRGDSLVMVGLGPHGGRAFVLRQEGEAVTFESFIDRALPFPPRYMLLDVHRTWLLGLSGAPLPDGTHTAEVEGERVTEAWSDGRLRSRTFERLDGVPAGRITITYEGGLDPAPSSVPPTRIELDNAWFGYRLLLEGLSIQPL